MIPHHMIYELDCIESEAFRSRLAIANSFQQLIRFGITDHHVGNLLGLLRSTDRDLQRDACEGMLERLVDLLNQPIGEYAMPWDTAGAWYLWLLHVVSWPIDSKILTRCFQHPKLFWTRMAARYIGTVAYHGSEDATMQFREELDRSIAQSKQAKAAQLTLAQLLDAAPEASPSDGFPDPDAIVIEGKLLYFSQMTNEHIRELVQGKGTK